MSGFKIYLHFAVTSSHFPPLWLVQLRLHWGPYVPCGHESVHAAPFQTLLQLVSYTDHPCDCSWQCCLLNFHMYDSPLPQIRQESLTNSHNIQVDKYDCRQTVTHSSVLTIAAAASLSIRSWWAWHFTISSFPASCTRAASSDTVTGCRALARTGLTTFRSKSVTTAGYE